MDDFHSGWCILDAWDLTTYKKAKEEAEEDEEEEE
jgi:hypothetical protein